MTLHCEKGKSYLSPYESKDNVTQRRRSIIMSHTAAAEAPTGSAVDPREYGKQACDRKAGYWKMFIVWGLFPNYYLICRTISGMTSLAQHDFK